MHAYKDKILIAWQNQSISAQRQDISPNVTFLVKLMKIN